VHELVQAQRHQPAAHHEDEHAGPAVNIVASAILLVGLNAAGPDLPRDHFALWGALCFLAFLQIATAILNLIPIPGLDGYGVIEPWLGREARRLGDQVRPYGLLIMFALLFAIPSTRDLLSRWTYDIMDATTNEVTKYGSWVGAQLFKFWKS
jgi:Zn-dependent protease